MVGAVVQCVAAVWCGAALRSVGLVGQCGAVRCGAVRCGSAVLRSVGRSVGRCGALVLCGAAVRVWGGAAVSRSVA